jgi:hypothetical protein
MKRICLAILLLGTLQGCMFYYKVQTINPVTSDAINQYDSFNKYLILHDRDSVYHMSIIRYITDSSLLGYLNALPGTCSQYKTTKPHGGNRYHKDNEYDKDYILKQVHLYLLDSIVQISNVNERIEIPYQAIQKAEIYQKAKGLTFISWFIPITLATLSSLIIISSIAMSNMTINLGGL